MAPHRFSFSRLCEVRVRYVTKADQEIAQRVYDATLQFLASVNIFDPITRTTIDENYNFVSYLFAPEMTRPIAEQVAKVAREKGAFRATVEISHGCKE